MNRRKFWLTTLCSLSSACAQEQRSVLSAAEEMERTEELALLDGESIATFDRTWSSHLEGPSGSWYPAVASPDGKFVGWAGLATAPADRSVQRVVLRDAYGASQSIVLNGFPGALAIASGGQKIATILRHGDRSRLMVVDTSTGHERDLSPAVPDLDLRKPERIRLSGNGERLLFGSGGVFRIIDVKSGSILLNKAMGYPSISPDGSRLAAADGNKLTVHNLDSGFDFYIDTNQRIDFVGCWSPNQRFVLLGGFDIKFWKFTSILVDLAQRAFAESHRQSGEMSSEIYWLSKGFGLV